MIGQFLTRVFTRRRDTAIVRAHIKLYLRYPGTSSYYCHRLNRPPLDRKTTLQTTVNFLSPRSSRETTPKTPNYHNDLC